MCLCLCIYTLCSVHVLVCACVSKYRGRKTDSAAEGFWRSFPCRLFHLLPEPKLWSNIIQTWCIIDDFLEWPPKEQNINEFLWLEEGRMFSIFKDIIIPHFSLFSCIPSLNVLKARSHSKWYFFYQCWRWCWWVSGWFVWVLVIHWGDHLFVPLTLDSN